MGAKGVTVVIDPNALVPAVTIIRMSNQELEHDAVELRTRATETLESGMMEGERLEGQKEAIQTILSGCDQLSKLFTDLSAATGKVYEKYINAETKQAIDAQVASHMETLQRTGSGEALRKK